MRIFTNGYPTNLPDSEKVSQGGPANFARLFTNYIEATGAGHLWIGVMLEGVKSRSTRLQKVFEGERRHYFRLRTPRTHLRAVVKARSVARKPEITLKKSVDRLARLIQAEKPDVVFLNGFGLLNWMILKAAEKTGVPVVIQHAGIWTKELIIHKKLYTPAGLKLMKDMEKDSTRLAAMEIFLNRWSRDYYRTHVAKNSDEKTSIIPLPFDFASFKLLGDTAGGSRFSFDPSRFHIGMIARWDEIKNHKAVLALAKKARQKKLAWDFHSIVDIPDVKKYADERQKYQKHIDVIAPVGRQGISEFCRSVDLLLLPSLFDVSPTVVLEAIACGTPIVISSTIGYVHDFQMYGGKPWIINPENTGRSLNKIQRLAGKKIPEQLRRRIHAIHDHKKVFEAYLEVFENVRSKETRAENPSTRPIAYFSARSYVTA